MALIEFADVCLSYENHIVISALSFVLNAGNYLGIVGENGSGKTTLMKALLSLKTATKGQIKIGDGLLRWEIGYLPQQTTAQKDFPASVWEVVLSGHQNSRGLRPFYSAREKKCALENMNMLGISSLRHHSYRELSGGQQQRVLLARALCATKKLIVLDEPTAGLDPVASADLYQFIQQLNAQGVTIVMVSHDMQNTVKYTSHILHLQGETFFFGTTQQYRESSIGKRFLADASWNR